MAQKKPEAKKPEATKKGKEKEPQLSEKEAKRKARLEKLKDRPAVQRPNSRQVDIIDAGTGKVLTFGYPIRKTGTLATSVLLDSKGNPIGISSAFIPGTKVKVKKNHGMIQPGLAGSGKKGKDEEEDDDEE